MCVHLRTERLAMGVAIASRKSKCVQVGRVPGRVGWRPSGGCADTRRKSDCFPRGRGRRLPHARRCRENGRREAKAIGRVARAGSSSGLVGRTAWGPACAYVSFHVWSQLRRVRGEYKLVRLVIGSSPHPVPTSAPLRPRCLYTTPAAHPPPSNALPNAPQRPDTPASRIANRS
ncbi:hypothetical protein C8Q78DRAFT_16585 [Trametes maxima]|nr:hypothetical protein C8Q78DRAFT_16585 [Trametes maxima]